MATQNVLPGAANGSAETLKTVTDAMRTTGASAVAGQREVVGLALAQSKENANTLIGTLQTIAAASSPFDAVTLYMRFLVGAPQLQMQHARALGESMARSSKAAWQPIVDAIAEAKMRSPTAPLAAV